MSARCLETSLVRVVELVPRNANTPSFVVGGGVSGFTTEFRPVSGHRAYLRQKGWAMSLQQLVVTAVRVQGRTKAEVSRDYGVSPRWVYELCRRFDAEGEAGLKPRSRRPRRVPGRTSDVLEDEIVELRKELTDRGLDGGPTRSRCIWSGATVPHGGGRTRTGWLGRSSAGCTRPRRLTRSGRLGPRRLHGWRRGNHPSTTTGQAWYLIRTGRCHTWRSPGT